MANVTEQDIIDHLKEKIQFHQKEAKRLENVLSAFVSDSAATHTRKTKPETVDDTIEPPAIPTQPAVRKAKTTKPAKPESPASPRLEIPAKYTDNLPPEARIAFALNEIGGSGYATDIANAMAQYEPKLDAAKISRQIATVLTSLKDQGLITAERSGRKERYTLVA